MSSKQYPNCAICAWVLTREMKVQMMDMSLPASICTAIGNKATSQVHGKGACRKVFKTKTNALLEEAMMNDEH